MAIGTPHLYGNKKWKGLEYTLVLGNKTTHTIYVIQYTPYILTYIQYVHASVLKAKYTSVCRY